MLTGPDVSNYQGVVDMQAVKNAGHVFVGIKATEGGSYLDPQFSRNRQHARDAGLIRLLYHFGRPSSIGTTADAEAEADWFCNHLGTLETGEIAILDIEDPAVGSGTDLGPWALAFLGHVDSRTGRAGNPDDDAELYTYGPYATAHLRLTSKLADRHLWFAAYTDNPKVPAPWHDWTFWQHTSNGSCPGIVGRCDLNKFTGPLDALQRIAGITVAPSDQEALLMSAAKNDDDARRALVRQWCLEQWGSEPTVDEHNILTYNFGLNGADDTLAHIADHAHAQAFRQKRGW